MTTASNARITGRTAVLTLLALTGFAANSVLCRLALRETAIAPAPFTALRIGSGALALWAIARATGARAATDPRPGGGDWASAVALFAYAAAFSFSYVTLPTAVGALLLFPTVHLVMLGRGLVAGERLTPLQTIGAVAAAVGLLVLLLPGWVTPSLVGGLLMVAAGVAWSVYSLRGRGSKQPLLDTAGNFARAVPLAAALLAFSLLPNRLEIDARGAALAVASGVVASGIGYAIWYAALPGLPTTVAATAQLPVPLLAALGGAIVIGEPLTARLALPGVLVLGGVALVLFAGRAKEGG
jgi:drug/metabolite transporter (DMT)-like permease